jgi:hypothetical protein
MSKLIRHIVMGMINFCKWVGYIVKTTNTKQRPKLFTAVWFFVCGLLAIEIYAIDPDMTVWDVMGYSLGSSLIFAMLGAIFGSAILDMPKKELQLFKVAGLGALCGLFFTLIIVFIVPIYLLLSHALSMPNTQQAEQLLLLYGVIVPFAYIWLPAIIVGAITAVLLRLADCWFKTEPMELPQS